MKLNKTKTKTKPKNKIHPTPPLTTQPPLTQQSLNDPIKTLNLLLPSTILTLISTLPLSDCEVLAYMLIHSLKLSKDSKNKVSFSHCFECGCFDCYTGYWCRWDSSPNREVIHQAIEGFEEYLASCEGVKGGKKRVKGKKERVLDVGIGKDPVLEVGIVKDPGLEVGFGNGWDPVEERVGFGGGDVAEGGSGCADVEERGGDGADVEGREETKDGKLVLRGEEHKGLARKMLPDVIGLFNSRLWNLWGPNV